MHVLGIGILRKRIDVVEGVDIRAGVLAKQRLIGLGEGAAIDA
jgi:hypothetical protein